MCNLRSLSESPYSLLDRISHWSSECSRFYTYAYTCNPRLPSLGSSIYVSELLKLVIFDNFPFGNITKDIFSRFTYYFQYLLCYFIKGTQRTFFPHVPTSISSFSPKTSIRVSITRCAGNMKNVFYFLIKTVSCNSILLITFASNPVESQQINGQSR